MILLGDCRERMAEMEAESVDAVVTLRAPLNRRIGSAMARAAERDEIRRPVRLSIIHEQPKRADVMHVRSRLSAMLARSPVPSPRAASLGLPIRATEPGGAARNAHQEQKPAPSGRWPANVVLSHTSECREVGTRRVKVKPNGGAHAATGAFPIENAAPIGYASPDSTETVPAFDCSPECPVQILNEQSGESNSPKTYTRDADAFGQSSLHSIGQKAGTQAVNFGDSGGASRFFYTSKASRWDREDGLSTETEYEHSGPRGHTANGDGTPRPRPRPRGNHHPTVKPTDLMRWLCRLVTPPGGLILDPFAGSGSTGVAAVAEGFRFIGIEQDAEYVAIAERRIANVAPLFAGAEETR